VGKFLNAQSTALLLIQKNGTKGTLARRNASSFNPVTQVETATTDTEEFDVVVLPPSQQAKFKVGSLEGRNAVEVYLAQKGRTMTPQPGDVLTVGGKAYTLFWAQTYDPALDGPIFTLAYAE
jgi:hypothetical protein